MKKVGFVGWRGIVGSMLMKRMNEEKDFKFIQPVFFSISCNEKRKKILPNGKIGYIQNAKNLSILKNMDIIVTCQGNQYTRDTYLKLRKIGWNGYWIDSSSELRMHKDSIIILDPINQKEIIKGINNGIKILTVGNCTVNLMLMSLHGLFLQDVIEWISVSTYQSVSGGGSKCVQQLFTQMGSLNNIAFKGLSSKEECEIFDAMCRIINFVNEKIFLEDNVDVPLAGNLIPWIGDPSNDVGKSMEEWKGQEEANKILNKKKFIPINSICVRVGTICSHGQSFIIKLKKDISIFEIEKMLSEGNDWIKVIPNNKESSIKKLNSFSVSGTLNIAIGRIRKLNFGKNYISAFSVGDQLLWGSSEPIRRMIKQLIQ